MIRRHSAGVSAIIIGIASTHLVTPTAVAQPTFTGQTIRLAVSATSGSPPDILARQFAPYITKHIPGQPQVIVENRPGAVGVVGANFVFNLAKPDGTTIGFLLNVVTPGLIGGDSVRFDLAKFHWLGAVSQTNVLLAHKDLKLSRFRDLLKPAKPLILGSEGITGPAGMANRLFLDMIGAQYKHVSGYPGQGEIILALSRGEITLANAGHTLYLARRDAIRQEGIYDAFLQRGEFAPDGTFQRNRQLPEVPTMIEAIRELNSAAERSVEFATYRGVVAALALQFGFMLPPGAPSGILAVLRKSIGDALNDPEARKTVMQSLKVDYDFIDGEMSQRLVATIRAEYHSDPRIAARIKQLITEVK